MKPFDEKEMRRHWESEATDYTIGRKLSLVDNRVAELVKAESGKRVLEIGFGSFITGAKIIEQCPGCRYIGLDFAEKFIRIAQEKIPPEASLVKGSASWLPFHSRSFDWVLEMDAIHHFPLSLLPDVVAEVAAVVKDDGFLVLVEDWAAPIENEKERLANSIQARRYLTESGLEYHPSESEWTEMLTAAGMKVVHLEHIDRPLHLRKFDELQDPDSVQELTELRKLWGDEAATTRMSLIISQRS